MNFKSSVLETKFATKFNRHSGQPESQSVNPEFCRGVCHALHAGWNPEPTRRAGMTAKNVTNNSTNFWVTTLDPGHWLDVLSLYAIKLVRKNDNGARRRRLDGGSRKKKNR